MRQEQFSVTLYSYTLHSFFNKITDVNTCLLTSTSKEIYRNVFFIIIEMVISNKMIDVEFDDICNINIFEKENLKRTRLFCTHIERLKN